MTIIRLHTISPDPLCPGRLLWATFLLAQKHIVQPSSANMQKHLGWEKNGNWTTSRESNIWLGIYDHQWRSVFFFTATSHIWKEKKGNCWRERKKKEQMSKLVQAPAAFQFIAQWTIMFRFFCCHVGIIPHEVQTQLSTAGEMFFRSRRQQNDASWQPEDHLSLRLRAIGRRLMFQTKSTRNTNSINPMLLVVDGKRPDVSLEKLHVCFLVALSR